MPSINTNMAANISVRNLNEVNAQSTSTLQKMSSGNAINQASDDASGLAIHTELQTDEVAWVQAGENAETATAILETADGGAGEIADILQRMYALASESNSGSVTDAEREYLDAEYQQLVLEIDAIATGTTYNGQSLLDGTGEMGIDPADDGSNTGTGVDFQVGVNSADTITVLFGDLNTNVLGIDDPATPTTAALNATDLLTQAGAADALASLDEAIRQVSDERASIGATQSRFEYRSGVIDTSIENLQSAQSVIMDADVAQLSAEQTTLGVKSDSAINALALANENLEKLSRLLS